MFLKKKIVSLKKSSTLAKRHFLDFSWVFLTKWADFLTFISRFACDESDFIEIFFFSDTPSQIFLTRQKTRQIVSKQVKNRSKQVKFFFYKSCTFRHLFSVPHSICCYFLATPATYFAKMAKKSKFHYIWLIFRKIALDQGKKSSATSKMSPMGSFRMFPHHIT